MVSLPAQKLFADDCALYREVLNIEDAESLQRDLRTLSGWSNQWQLRFNAAKCKAMQITNKKSTVDFSYRINTTALEWVTSFKYLGVINRYEIKLERSCKPCCNEGIQNPEPIQGRF